MLHSLRPTLEEQLHKHPIAFFGAIAVFLGLTAAVVVQVVQDPLVIFLGVSALLIGFLALSFLEYSVLVLVFITYIRLSDVLIAHHGAPSIAKLIVPLMMGILIARWIIWGRTPSPWYKAALLLGLYGVIGFASLLYASNPAATEKLLVDYAKDVLIAFIVIMTLRRGPTLRLLLWVLIGAGIFLGTITVYQQLTGTFDFNYWGFAQADVRNIIGGSSDYRIAGPISSNYYALILVALVPIALDRLWHEESPWLQAIASWCVGVTTLSIIFTYSRGGFIALCVVVGLFFIYKRLNPLLLIVGFAALFIVGQFLPDQYTARLATLTELVSDDDETPADSSFRGRLSEVTAAYQMFADHPIRGVGLGNYNSNYQLYSKNLGLDTRATERSAHSLYLEVAAESGIVGIIVFAMIFVILFRDLWRAYKEFRSQGNSDYAHMSVAISLSIIGYLIGSIFLHLAYPRYFWLWIGIGFAVPNIARYESLRSSPTVERGLDVAASDTNHSTSAT